ncbi:MAG TPA: acetyltransferase [Syntrophorhabdaceae bacterium]|nr:acetyltransferase [Syntrophorhabdaceae bacterium]
MMTKEDLLIFPRNGNGLEALHCVGPRLHLIGFIDDDEKKQGTDPLGHRVLTRDALDVYPRAGVLAVPGSPDSYRARMDIIHGLCPDDRRFVSIIHPSAQVSPFAQVGFNTLIMAGVAITGNAVIGNHVIILPNTVIHHDSEISDWSIIGSGVTIAGSVTIGENCYIGSGSHIMHGLSIGDRTLIGLGSTVIRTVEADLKAAGNPARIIGSTNNGQERGL